jgi:hypothetical protein
MSLTLSVLQTFDSVASADLEITVQMLVQIDKLVQLIESPVFTCMSAFPVLEWSDHVLQISDYSFLNPNDILICSNVSMACSCSYPRAQPSFRFEID